MSQLPLEKTPYTCSYSDDKEAHSGSCCGLEANHIGTDEMLILSSLTRTNRFGERVKNKGLKMTLAIGPSKVAEAS